MGVAAAPIIPLWAPPIRPNDLHIRLSLLVSPSWLIFLPPVSPIELSDQVSQSFAFSFARLPLRLCLCLRLRSHQAKIQKQSWCYGTVLRASPGLGIHVHSSSVYKPCPDTKGICGNIKNTGSGAGYSQDMPRLASWPLSCCYKPHGSRERRSAL